MSTITIGAEGYSEDNDEEKLQEKFNQQEQAFWSAAFVASMENGHTTQVCSDRANMAVRAQRIAFKQHGAEARKRLAALGLSTPG